VKEIQEKPQEAIHKILNEIDENIPNSSEFSNAELEYLEEFSFHHADDIRSRVAVILASFTEKRGEDILLRLAKDKDSLVRVEACDSLSNSKSFSTFEFLKRIIKEDRNGMVRGYAISSLNELSIKLYKNPETVRFLLEVLNSEAVEFSKINIYKALYNMGEKQYLQYLLKGLNTSVYQNRCATVNLLEEIIDDENEKEIKEALEERIKVEKTKAVSSTIIKVLKQIEDR